MPIYTVHTLWNQHNPLRNSSEVLQYNLWEEFPLSVLGQDKMAKPSQAHESFVAPAVQNAVINMKVATLQSRPSLQSRAFSKMAQTFKSWPNLQDARSRQESLQNAFQICRGLPAFKDLLIAMDGPQRRLEHARRIAGTSRSASRTAPPFGPSTFFGPDAHGPPAPQNSAAALLAIGSLRMQLR